MTGMGLIILTRIIEQNIHHLKWIITHIYYIQDFI